MNVTPWRVVGASVSGKRHLKTDQPCQDAHLWRVLASDILIVAVADGAGSASLADQGATLAVRATMDFLAGQTTWPAWTSDSTTGQALLRQTMTVARDELLKEAQKRGVAARELATTLLFLIAAPEAIAAAQVGDGAIVMKTPDDPWSTLTCPGPAEYLNETTFLTSADAVEKAQLVIRPLRANQVALLSDGLQMLALKMPQCVPHAPFFNPLFRLTESTLTPTEAVEQLNTFLRSPRLSDRTDDDLTLILANRDFP